MFFERKGDSFEIKILIYLRKNILKNNHLFLLYFGIFIISFDENVKKKKKIFLILGKNNFLKNKTRLDRIQ